MIFLFCGVHYFGCYNFVYCFEIVCAASVFFVCFFVDLFNNYTGWIIVLSLIDQFLSVRYSSKFQFRKKLKFQLLAILITFMALLCIDAPYIVYDDIYFYNNESKCITGNAYIDFYVSVTNTLTSAIIPFVLMIIFSGLIGHFLIRHRKNLQIRRKTRKELRMVKLWFATSLFFLICTLPFYIQGLVHDLISFHDPNFFFSDYLFDFLYSITWMFSHVPNSFEIFVCLSTNKVFRDYFFSIFILKKNRVTPTTVTIV